MKIRNQIRSGGLRGGQPEQTIPEHDKKQRWFQPTINTADLAAKIHFAYQDIIQYTVSDSQLIHVQNVVHEMIKEEVMQFMRDVKNEELKLRKNKCAK